MNGYCKVVKVEHANLITNSKRMWVLTHECGRIERRVAKHKNRAEYVPPPTRVKCENAKAEGRTP